MSRIVTSISVLKSLKEEAVDAAVKGQYPGTSNFSAMVELALDKMLHQGTTPYETVEPEVAA
ncbi:hypothetical protein E4H04_13125 [Candidatus Bathyarchaeota archaeon]|nr:MAG: hypothetical protein E4H04_13125 [Candidatus Bathyarchaeota archaeon]